MTRVGEGRGAQAKPQSMGREEAGGDARLPRPMRNSCTRSTRKPAPRAGFDAGDRRE
jgi:hypothetical protein